MEKYDIIIVGGGPAAITAGIYVARKNVKALILTKNFIGQVGLTSKVENWPGISSMLGIDLIKRFKEHLQEYNIAIKEGFVVESIKKNNKGFTLIANSAEFFAKSVILATGRKPRKLGIKGEDKFAGMGVSYCVVCDGPLFKGKQVAVIGGGNSGFTSALELSNYVKKVFIIERENKIIADEILWSRARKAQNIEIYKNKDIKEIKGNKEVEELVCEDFETKKVLSFKIAGVFIEAGSIPNTEYLRNIVKLNRNKEVVVDCERCETSVKGLFAAGDINDKKYKQIITASADGARAALAAYEYISVD